MSTMKSLFMLIITLLATVSCTNNSNEFIDLNKPISRSANSVSMFRFDPSYVATTLDGPYEDVNKYLMMSTGHYLVSEHFYLQCVVRNNSGNDIIFNPSLLRISLGNSSSKIAVPLKFSNGQGILINTTIPVNGSIITYFELPSSFMSERIDINIPQIVPSLYYVTNIYFYYDGNEQEFPLYNFLFSTHYEENRN